MKFQKIYRFLLAGVAAAGCHDGQQPTPPAKHGGPAEAATLDWERADPASGAPLTPGGAIYGEVVAATDEIVGVLEGVSDADSAALAAPTLHNAVGRYEAAARNWQFYLANTDDREVRAIERSRLIEHADQSDERLRENLQRLARDPSTESLRPEIQSLLRALRQGMTTAERARFEQWMEESGLTEGQNDGGTE